MVLYRQLSYWELQEHISKQNIEESMLVIKINYNAQNN